MVCSLEKGRKVLKNGVPTFTERYKAFALILYETTTLFKKCSNFVQKLFERNYYHAVTFSTDFE